MSRKIITNYITSSSRPRQALNAIGMVVHDTGDPGATAKNEHDYFQNQAPRTSAHAFVDWTQTVITIPFNEKAWHAGPHANPRFIGVELCIPPTHDPAKFKIVWDAAVELFAMTFKNDLKITKITKDNLMSHAEVSNKWHKTDHLDPVAYFKEYEKTVDNFRSDVQAHINAMSDSSNLAKPKQLAPVLTREVCREIQSMLNHLGKCSLAVDGIVGPKTSAAVANFQSTHGLKSTGVLTAETIIKIKLVVASIK